jgi:hypothetical protein
MIEKIETGPKVRHRGKLSYNEFGERIKTQMRREHRELRHPEGDVQPRAFLYFGERLFEMPLDPGWFSSRDAKDALTAQIVEFVRLVPMVERIAFERPSGVGYVGLVYTMYRALQDLSNMTDEQRAALERNELPAGYVQPSQDPQREEVLSVMALDREIVKAWHGVIHRTAKKPPRLGKWEDLEEAWGLPTGLMLDPIREAMR